MRMEYSFIRKIVTNLFSLENKGEHSIPVKFFLLIPFLKL